MGKEEEINIKKLMLYDAKTTSCNTNQKRALCAKDNNAGSIYQDSQEINGNMKSYSQLTKAKATELTFQSSVVTSLLFSFVLPFTCFSTRTFKGVFFTANLEAPSAIVQIRAVESPDLGNYARSQI